MLSISSLIEFLLGLLRDEDAQAEFERNPQEVLARHGLEGVTGQDIRDVQPMLADCSGVSYRDSADHGSSYAAASYGGGGSYGGHSYGGASYGGASYGGGSHDGGRHYGGDDDPVRVIHHVTKTHHVEREVIVKQHAPEHNYYTEYNQEFNYYDYSVTASDGSTIIQDSYNQTGVDNRGGVINDSNVAGNDQSNVGNDTSTVTLTDSNNTDNSVDNSIADSANDSSNNAIIESGNDSSNNSANDSFNESSSNSSAVNNSYEVNAPTAAVDAQDAGLTESAA